MSGEFINNEKTAATLNGGVGPDDEIGNVETPIPTKGELGSAEPPIPTKDKLNSAEPLIQTKGKLDSAEPAISTKDKLDNTEPPIQTKDDNESESSKDLSAEIDNKSEVPEEKPEWLDVLGSGSIMKKTVKEGRPDTRPERNQKCTVNYTCSLEDGMLVDTVTGFELYLGECDVISGLDVALGLMNVEERSILKIQPRLAYGKKGLFPRIPADSTVVFDIELLKVDEEEDIERLSIRQRKLLGNRKRERGNWWYMRGENNIAIQCYRRALDYLEEVERRGVGDSAADPVTDTELQSLLEDRISVHNNMAAAQIKMEMYQPALDSLQTVLTCQPENIKAHFRKAKVYIGKNDLQTAMSCLLKAQKLAPEDPEIQKEISNVKRLLEKQKATERELARRMFNGPKKADGDDSEKGKNAKSKLSLWATVGAALTLGVASFIAYRLK